MSSQKQISTDDFQDEIVRQCDIDANHRSLFGIPTYILGWGLIVVSTQISDYTPVFSYLIGALLIILAVARLFYFTLFNRFYAQNPNRWRLWFAAGTLSSTALWSLFTCVSLYQLGMSYEAVIVLIPVIMICSGGIYSLAPIQFVVISFLAISLIPLLIALLLLGNSNAYASAFMVFIFFLFSSIYGRTSNQNYIQLIHKNLLLQKHSEELELAKKLAEEANIAKSQFLANMSHELRTPMNGILGAAELIGSTKINSEQKKLVQIIKHSGTTLMSLLNDLLDFSKIESGNMEIISKPFNLDEELQYLHKLIDMEAKKKDLKFTITKHPDIGEWLKADVIRIQQVLLNLLANAIKFTEKGSISLNVKLTPNKQMIRFEIQDTGIGISEEQKLLVFQRFQQTESSSTRKYGGAGLGLSISKNLVELMLGSIGVESEPGKGSFFWFELPYQIAELESVEAKPEETLEVSNLAKFKGCRILLAEDNRVNQIIATEILKQLGIAQVTVVNNGNEAVNELISKDYDLVLMDIQMPGCDGIEACQRVRDRALGYHVRDREIPIIALTANVMKSDIDEYLSAGMSGHLGKPIKKTDLLTELNKWLPAQCLNNANASHSPD